jgi:alpha-glucoside transport system permease protein
MAPVQVSRTLAPAPPSSASLDPAGRVYRFLRAIPTWVLWALAVVWSIPSVGLVVSTLHLQDDQYSGFWTAFTSGTEGWTLDVYRYTLDLESTNSFTDGMLNSVAVAVPATILPLAIAAAAAYAFAWLDFPGRRALFITVVAFIAVPFQVSLIPLLQLFVGGAHLTLFDHTITVFPDLDLNGTITAVWLTHIGFALPFGIFLIHNAMARLPRDIIDMARLEGAGELTILVRIALPLTVPVLAAFGILQFLTAWNDYLVAVTLIGFNTEAMPATVKFAGGIMPGGLVEGASVVMHSAVSVIVFLVMQRYFVRGLLAGSVGE